MRNSIIIAVIFFLIVTPCFADFRFAVIGDTRDNSEDGINNKVMEKILDNIKSENAGFILLTGDMITGSRVSAIHRNRLRKWRAIIEGYKIPYYISVGNHEIESEVSERIINSVFEMPKNGPEGLKGLVYSFDYKNAHFIILDTNVYDNFHVITEEQLEWLKDDLKKNKKNIIFIFGHEPAYPVYDHKGRSLDRYSSKRDYLWNIFKEHKVNIYFCGHEHLYHRAVYDGVYQIITGGAGAYLTASHEQGGFYHFILVDVKDNSSIEISVKDMKGVTKDIFKIEY